MAAWVDRFGVLRTTAVLAALSSIVSLLLTWLSLAWAGHQSMGNAWWIAMLVPIPLTLFFGGVSLSLLAALNEANRQMQDLAMLDPLTGLDNRRRFLAAAGREIELASRHGLPLALLMLDVDHFKSINDRYGHQLGDRVLVEVGRRCKAALRGTDIVARWGGEEFIVLLPNTQTRQARWLAERIRESIAGSAQVSLMDLDIRVTVSVGAAGCEQAGPSALDELIVRADNELYRAKQEGRNRVSSTDPLATAFNTSASAHEVGLRH